MGSILNFSKIAYAHDVVKKWAYITEGTKYLYFFLLFPTLGYFFSSVTKG